MRLHKILLEYDTKITAQKQGPALTARWLADSSAKREVDGHSAKTPEDILEFLEYADPTKNKQYMLWIIKQYIAKNFMYEDIEGLKAEIELYHTMKPRLPVEQRDIGRFDLGKFREMMMSYEGAGGDFELTGEVSEEDVDILVNSPQGVLARAKTEKGACEMGKGTKWCTAGTDGSNYADDYIQGSEPLEQPYGDGLFIYWEYPGKKKYQLHFGNEDYDGDYDEYGAEPLPGITVMDAQDQTVFTKDADWLVRRQNNPVLSGLITAMQNFYNKELKMVDMFDQGDDEDTAYYDGDSPYDTFFDSWRKLFGLSSNANIEKLIMDKLPHITKMDVEARKTANYYRGLQHELLDVNRFKFGLGYVSNIRGARWPQMEKLMISDFNKIGKMLSADEELFKKFFSSLNKNFVNFRDDLDFRVRQGMLSKTVKDAFDKNFLDKFTNPLILTSEDDEIINAVNVSWGEDFFAPQLSKQNITGFGVDIKSIPKLPPVPLQQAPAIELFKHIELKPMNTGFTISYKSVFASKGIFNREPNLFDRMRYSIDVLYKMTLNLSRDLPGVSFYDDVKNASSLPSELEQLGTKNSPLLSDLKKQLESIGLDEDQVRNFVSTPAGGYGRTWAWGKLDPSLIFQNLFGSRKTLDTESMSPEQYQQVKAVYEILNPYMYKLDDKFFDIAVSNLKSSPLGQLKNAILDQMYKEILDLKNHRGSLFSIFKTAISRSMVAGELFANQAGQPLQFNDKGDVISGQITKSDNHTSMDYIRRQIIRKQPGYADLKLIAPDLSDPQTKKIYQQVSTEASKLSFDQAENYKFDKERTQTDIDRFEKIYKSFKPLSTTANDLPGG